jgi:methylmalonyl-CoA/ethylmalonyl-CoA epimerase
MEPHSGSDFLASFFARNPRGGLHHVTFVVPDLEPALAKAEAGGYEVIGRFASEDRGEAFLHPRTALGVLVQLVWKTDTYEPVGLGGTVEDVLAAPFPAAEGAMWASPTVDN